MTTYLARDVMEGDFLIEHGSTIRKVSELPSRVTFELANGETVSYDPTDEVATA
jgi:hypothetical protein